ncbi:MAG: DUF4625 domain-containing protein [Pedobacter sp.]|nr:MAG: DUF4625 domain-containing protein [Pedobacter sp.]
MQLNYNSSRKSKFTKFLLAFFTVAAIFSACKKENITAPPSITGLEVGSNNNKTAYPGSDLHIEAQLLAEGTIADVKVEIHPVAANGWKFEIDYKSEFAGKKNAELHKHIDVPANAALGKYHIHVIVTDQQGQVTEVESELEIKFDPSLPTATGFEVGLNTAGNDLHLEANLAAVNKIARVVVEIHGGNYEKEVVYTDAAMVGATTYNLHKHINVGDAPKGHYHVHLKVIDQSNKESEFEEHFDKP